MNDLLIFNLGPMETVIILAVALLVFGGRLPDVARSLGRSFTQFKRGLRDIEEDVERSSRDVLSEPPPAPKVSPQAPLSTEARVEPPSVVGTAAQEPKSSSSRDATS